MRVMAKILTTAVLVNSSLVMASSVTAPATPAAPSTAEVKSVTFAHQNGWAYLPLYVMDKLDLVEKHAKAKNIDVKAEYKNLGSPGVIRDSLISGGVHFGAVGVPTLISLADKTDFKMAANIVSLPMYLNTREDVKSVCDLKGKGKIALPTIKVSVQAVTLQMATDKYCKDPLFLDDQTVSMTHPDAMQALLSNQVSSHFTSPPFQYIELEKGKDLEAEKGMVKVKKLVDSYDVLGGKTSFIMLVGSDKFRVENPKVYEVVVAAFEEALKWINDNKKDAAKLYIEAEKSKETEADVLKQISDPNVVWDSTPDRVGVYAKFMFEKAKSVKKDMDWKFLSMPNLHGKKGS